VIDVEGKVEACRELFLLEVPLHKIDAVGHFRVFVERLLRLLQADLPVQHSARQLRVLFAERDGVEPVAPPEVQHPLGPLRQVDGVQHLVERAGGEPAHGGLVAATDGTGLDVLPAIDAVVGCLL